jgi:hydroxymethylpyrimidine kinase/phosphomethylpyrimidine kinase/thiamine-phosphate diphosphorylase
MLNDDKGARSLLPMIHDQLPLAWTIAGSDSGGGAGIQADLHTFQALGVHGCSVITALTAQNTVSVEGVFYVPPESILQQIQALQDDLPPAAIKIGMIGDSPNVAAIQSFLAKYEGVVVLDPVLVAGSGDALFISEKNTYNQVLASLYPFIDLITPNIPEAEALTGIQIRTYEDIETAADILLAQGVKSVLIKGGHFKDDLLSQDYWTNGAMHFWLSSKRALQHICHGTGCTLSSAITALLAKGIALKESLVMANMYVAQNLSEARQYGAGSLLLPHPSPVEKQAYLPYLSQQPLDNVPTSFPECGHDLGLYPVVDSVEWLSILLPLGIKTIQLRIKDKTAQALEDEIQQAVVIAEKHGARLFINDYWTLAIKHRAYGVHLGQEDLLTADIQQIKDAGLRLGLSTHSYEELATAHMHHPSYIAFGPIFPTTSKEMPFDPQGLAKLRQMRRLLDYPLVAIGGIGQDNILEVAKTGVDGIAMISAITRSDNPVEAARVLMGLIPQINRI